MSPTQAMAIRAKKEHLVKELGELRQLITEAGYDDACVEKKVLDPLHRLGPVVYACGMVDGATQASPRQLELWESEWEPKAATGPHA